jgi:hypothetical protein
MTMQHESHPHDERLAGLAGADPEATGDRALREHVATCERCSSVVDEIGLLRSALAELPDLRPSRPLQILPPVAAPAATRGGVLGVLRRLSAPALAAGAALILVGAVGSTGLLQGFAGSAASAPMFENVGENLGAAAEYGSPEASAQPSDAGDLMSPRLPAASSGDSRGVLSAPSGSEKAAPSAAPAPARTGDDLIALNGTPEPLSRRLVWLLILSVGVVLAGGSLLLRFTLQPRAG